MKILVIFATLLLVGCSTASQQNFSNGVQQFNTDVALVNGAIANVSSTLYANCNGITATASAISAFAGTSSKVGNALVAANAAINSYCSSPVVTNIPTAIQATASAYSAAKSSLNAVKAGG